MFRSIWRLWKKDWARTSRRPSRASTRRPTLEALEDRMVLSSAHQVGPTLNIISDPGTATHVRSILMEVDPIHHTQIHVIDAGTLLGQLTISSTHTVLA